MSDEPDKPAPGARQPSCIGAPPYYGPLPEPKKSNDSLLAQAINGMSDEPKKRWSWTTGAWVIVLSLVAYIASEGPVEDLAVRAYHATGWKRVARFGSDLYAPLRWAEDHLR
jgi:hypothetical protein